MICLKALCCKQNEVFFKRWQFSGFKCLLWESGGKQWMVNVSDCVRIRLNIDDLVLLMYQQFLLFAEKLMKLSFSETKFPLDALCKIKSWVCEVRNWYYRFYAMCAVFFAASLNRPALVLSFSSKSEVFLGMLPPVVLHCPEEISSPDPLFPLSASTVRHLYLRGGVGVGSMTKIYGGRKRNGVCPSHFSVGSKNVARKVLQALEGLKMVEKDPNGWVVCRLLFTICDLYYCRWCVF